jgi:23S rRNA (guanosine2251-2'-O)-methyltransferase
MDEKQAYIFGRNSVLEALHSDSSRIEKIFITYSAKGDAINKIFSRAKREKVQCVKQDNKKFIALERSVVPKGGNTQGVIALMRMFETVNIEELIKIAFDSDQNPVIIALDGINDPHNLGAITRAAECSGAAGLLISERESAPITPTAVKISSGALEHLPVAKASSFSLAFEKFKEAGFWIVGTDMEGEQLYTDFDFIRPVVIVIGSEGKGLRPSTRKHCDVLVKIPVKGKVGSLNASVSAGIVLYEALRQKESQRDGVFY